MVGKRLRKGTVRGKETKVAISKMTVIEKSGINNLHNVVTTDPDKNKHTSITVAFSALADSENCISQ